MNNSSTYLLYYTASHQRAGAPAKVFRQKSFAQWKLSWQDIYFQGLWLGFDTSFIWFFFFGKAGWIGRETEGDWKRPCPLLANLYPLAKLIAAVEISRFLALSRAYRRRNFSQSPLGARNRSSFVIQYPIRSLWSWSPCNLVPRPLFPNFREKRPGDEVGPHEEIRGEVFCHRSKKKVTKNVLSAIFNFL